MNLSCSKGQLRRQVVNNRHLNTEGVCLKHCCKSGEQHKMKQLKTRKQRSQMRGAQVRTHHQSHHHSRKLHYSCHNNCQFPPKRDTVLPKMHTEPSIITDSRLIGHHGLFNHEVKSFDIERFLSEQRKLEKHEQLSEENGVASPVSHNLSPKIHNVCQKEDESKGQSNTQGSGITPAQRLHVHPALSSDSEKPTSILDVSKNVTTETGAHRKLEETPNNVQFLNKKLKEPQKTLQDHQILAGVCSPASPLLSDPPAVPGAADPHLDLLSKSMVAAAARLCRGLQLPHLRRRDLAEESREVLLQALQENHGAGLQENLLRVQQCRSEDTWSTETVQQEDEEEKSLTADANGFWPTDPFSSLFPCNGDDRWHFSGQGSETQSESLLRFDWMPTRPSHQSLEHTADWLRSSDVERVVGFSENIDSSPQFRVDFEAPGTPCSNPLFALSAAGSWETQTSAPQGWNQRCSRTARRKLSASFDGLEESFLNQAAVVRERIDLPPFSDVFAQSVPPYPAGLIHRHAVVPQETHRLNYPQDSQHLQPQPHHPHIRFNCSPTWPSIRSHHTNNTHFPPSHMLDRYPASPPQSYLSPEHWSFPPMRLY